MIAVMANDDNKPATLLQAVHHFADYQNCHNFLVQIRWPDGKVCCPHCKSARVRYIQTRRQWECREQHPKRCFSLKTGTVLEDSPLPLEKWLAALWLEVNAKNSISSWEIHRTLGVTQKTAWFMLHRLRAALKSGSFEKMGGNGNPVEADETYIGGLSKNMHVSRRRKTIYGALGGKTPVMGLLERHSSKPSQVRAKVIRRASRENLYPIIHKNVEPGATIYTDALPAYRRLAAQYAHEFVDHAEAYVKGAVHTNGLENFWALLGRYIKGTHVSIDPAHLEAYVDSEAFRFNNRQLNDGGRFHLAAPGMIGKRLTYKALIGVSEGGTQASGAR
jgi:transposase-like protein